MSILLCAYYAESTVKTCIERCPQRFRMFHVCEFVEGSAFCCTLAMMLKNGNILLSLYEMRDVL